MEDLKILSANKLLQITIWNVTNNGYGLVH